MRSPAIHFALFGAFAGVLAGGCAADDLDIEDGERDSFAAAKADGALEDGSPEALGVLALVNDATVDFAELDLDAGLSSRAAANIINHRNGADGVVATADDDSYGDLAELDAIPYVGVATLDQLVAYAQATGRVHPAPHVEVIFSPQPAATTHNHQIATWIQAAQHTLDVAQYSFSDAEIAAALTDAIARGVKVRFLFDTASEDRKLEGTALANSKSGKLEKTGTDVRWVNKVLHHKFAVIDGPRDDAERAQSARLVSGSANWSFGGGQTYDEATLFVEHDAELAVSFQREFDRLWAHSRDFALATALPYELSTADLDGAGLDAADPDADAHFTSVNFTANGDTFRIIRTSTAMSDLLVAAINGAETSIHIAAGHLRLRPVAEALIARKTARPDLDIRVYLDQQEFISTSGNTAQVADLATCLAAATTDIQRWNCSASDFLFSKQVADAGIELRFKAYAYRWDVNYAVQMHNKFMVVDGAELYTGSYNLSMNSEQATFENVIHLHGASNAAIVATFESKFEQLWNTGRNPELLTGLRDQIATAAIIPLVFPSMALTWQEFNQLRTLVRANCTDADSAAYRENPAAHKTCPR